MKHHCCETCTSHLFGGDLRVGTPVMILRDTKRWPRAGTWKRYDGQTGRIDVVNYGIDRVEYGIALGGKTSWFLPHEVRVRL